MVYTHIIHALYAIYAMLQNALYTIPTIHILYICYMVCSRINKRNDFVSLSLSFYIPIYVMGYAYICIYISFYYYVYKMCICAREAQTVNSVCHGVRIFIYAKSPTCLFNLTTMNNGYNRSSSAISHHPAAPPLNNGTTGPRA